MGTNQDPNIYLLLRALNKFMKLLRKHPPTGRVIVIAFVALFGVAAAYYQQQIQTFTAGKAAGITLQTPNGTFLPIVQLGRAVTPAAVFTADSSCLTLIAKQHHGQPEWNSLIVPPGFTYSIVLADGSLVRLNAGSRLKFPSVFGPEKREVYLEGEAYFEVQSDANRLFILHSGLADVTVLGTTFNINSYSSRTRVSLVSGEVVINAKNKMVQLKPGQEATIDRQRGAVSVAPFQSNITLAWMEGLQIFLDTPLRDICDVLERMYNIRIHIDDAKLAATRYYAIVNRERPVQTFLQDLHATKNVNSVVDAKGELHLTLQ